MLIDLAQWQIAMSGLHSDFPDHSRAELRTIARDRGILICVDRGGWKYITKDGERSALAFRSERAALVAAINFSGDTEDAQCR